MPNYEKDDGRIAAIAEYCIERYHGHLRDNGVTIDFLFAHAKTNQNGDVEDAALKLNGYPCGAIVRIVGLKDRTKGNADAEIVVDGDQWDEWSRAEQIALIDHELQHLTLVPSKDGKGIKRDDLDRPKLKMRLHDRQFGWFDIIARRHGEAAFEVKQATEMFTDIEFRQLYLPSLEPVAN